MKRKKMRRIMRQYVMVCTAYVTGKLAILVWPYLKFAGRHFLWPLMCRVEATVAQRLGLTAEQHGAGPEIIACNIVVLIVLAASLAAAYFGWRAFAKSLFGDEA